MIQRWLPILLCLGILGCSGDEPIKVRLRPKSTQPVSIPAGGAAEPGAFNWQAPPDWLADGPQGMRAASYRVPGSGGEADASVTVLAGDGGGALSNVNRWRKQLGLEAWTRHEMEANVTIAPYTLDGSPVFLLGLQGTYKDGQREVADAELAAMFSFTRKGALFIKLVGPQQTMQEQSAAFASVSASVRLRGQPPGSSGSFPFTWRLPEGWNDLGPEGLRAGNFSVPGPDGAADASIVLLAGDGGGLLRNVELWRQQMGLPSVPSDSLEHDLRELPFAIDGAPAWFVRLAGSYQGKAGQKIEQAELLGVYCGTGHGALFVKMVGPAPTVDAQAENFAHLVHSLAEHQHEAPKDTTSQPGLAWQNPPGWVALGSSSTRLASFVLPGAAGDADLGVTLLPGDGGGTLNNVNRWRRQMGLEAVDAAQTGTQRLLAGRAAIFIDLAGDYQGMGGAGLPGARMLGVLTTDGVPAIFVKLVGPAATVSQHQAAFEAWLDTMEARP